MDTVDVKVKVGRAHGKGHGHGRREDEGRTSIMSYLGVDRQDMVELFDSRQTTGVYLLVKMLSVVGVPVVAVFLLSSILLYNSVDIHRQSNVAIDELRVFYQVDQLVTNLQVCTATHTL